MALPDRATNVLETLLGEPSFGTGPLVLVGYSLGGLVIKQTLRLAEERAALDSRAANLLRNVRRIIFIGTPHHGSDQAKIINTLRFAFRPSEATAGLSANDPHLRGLNSWFRIFVSTHDLDGLIMYETQPERIVGTIVKPSSADPGISPSIPVVAVDETHSTIVKPVDKDADVYKSVLSCVTAPFPDDSTTSDIATEQVIETLKEEVVGAKDEIKSAIAASAANVENPIISAETERRLSILLKSRNVVGFKTENATKTLLQDLLSGELTSTSKSTKSIALAWCSRILASLDPTAARSAYNAARSMGNGDETKIAEAFLHLFESNDKLEALANISALDAPSARTASLIIAGHDVDPNDTIQWFENSGLQITDLDSHGKFYLIQKRLEMKDWDMARADADRVTDEDFQNTPVLLITSAIVSLAHAIHPELRETILYQLPETLNDIPLADNAEAKELRLKALEFYNRAAQILRDLNCIRASHIAADSALALALRDPSSRAVALKELQDSMSRTEDRLRRLPTALHYKLNLDMDAVEEEVDQAMVLSGGRSEEGITARFAIAMSKPEPLETANYLAKHRADLTGYYRPEYIASIEIEALARSGDLSGAKTKLKALRDSGAGQKVLGTLERIIDEADGADPIGVREKQYQESGNLSDLLALVQTLREQGAFPKLVTFGKQLFDETKDLPHAITYSQALYEEGHDEEIIALARTYPELVDSSVELQSLLSWAHYRLGDLRSSTAALDKLRAVRDESNDRHLWVNITVASGNWSALAEFVEAEWSNRADRQAAELLRAGQIAQQIGSISRSKELIAAAAEEAIADSNAEILLGCYGAAISSGWEIRAEVSDWFGKAIELSGEDGPIQRVGLNELAEQQPEWAKREDSVYESLLTATSPMFAAARTLNRTLLDFFLVPSLLNTKEEDVRRRSLIFSFSGARPIIRSESKKLALDVTSLITLGLANRLKYVIDSHDAVVIAHTTLGWLFKERERLKFHQPSQVEKAREILQLVSDEVVRQFEGTTTPANLEKEVGVDMAQFLVAAKTLEQPDGANKVVVRPYPVSKPGTLMDEIADTSGYEDHLAGCSDLVEALSKQGRLTAAEEESARAYLSLHEKPWPHKATIEPGATLFLDDLAVSYLQFLGLMNPTKLAGYNVFVAKSHLDRANALVKHETISAEAEQLIEDLRATLSEGLDSGKVQLTSVDARQRDDDLFDIANHPTLLLLRRAKDIDAFVIDDRHYNPHARANTDNGEKDLLTSIDVLHGLVERGSMTSSQLQDDLAALRRAGFVFVPNRPDEIIHLVKSATVVDGVLNETGELRAIRESVLRIRMTDVLQLPNETIWTDGLTLSLIQAIREQWSDEIDDTTARAKSTWLLRLLDVRGWSHRNPIDGPQAEERYQALLQMLMMHPEASEAPLNRYLLWIEETVLAQFSEEHPEAYGRLVENVERLICESADRIPLGGGDEQ